MDGRPATIYAFDVLERSGSPFLSNRRVFVYVAAGVPASVHCDRAGNVYAACGDGVEVWSPGGVALGLIEVPGSWSPGSCCFLSSFLRSSSISTPPSRFHAYHDSS